MKIKFSFLFFLFLSMSAFAEQTNKNSISIETGLSNFTSGFSDNFLSLNYQRNFFDGKLGVSGGVGYMSIFQDNSFFAPIHAVFTPFDTMVSPEIFCGPVVSWNSYKRDTSFDKDKRIFDKGADVCMEFGAGLYVRPIASFASIGASVHWYTDFEGKVNGLLAFNAGYLF